MTGTPDPLILPDAASWRRWLDLHEHASDGVWLVLAKKGTTSPTSMGYDQALAEALCSGWIDGQRKGRDEATFLQRYTPRRRTSVWSQRNTLLVQQLIDQGRMRERGQAEIDKAKTDGRWERAYAGQATVQVPEDLQAGLDSSPTAAAAFAALNSQQRYHILHQLMIAASEKTRDARLRRFLEQLGRQQPGS